MAESLTLRSRLLATVLLIGVALVVVGASASVAPAATKSMQGFIGGTSAGLLPQPIGGAFIQPRDVAVYEGLDGDALTDKIFVVEDFGVSIRVQRLDRDGNFELLWGKDVDSSTPGTGHEICEVATACHKPSSGTGTGPGEFNGPTGLAVDQANGWVYVYDRSNKRIQKFDLNGNFLLMFGDGVNATDSTDVCTAADVTSGDVCGAGVGGTGGGQIGPAGATSLQVRGLAIDSGTGDVFVGDPSNRRVQQFDSTGAFQRAWGWDVDKTTVDNRFEVCTTSCGVGVNSSPANANGAFALSNPLHVAVDSNGIVYASDSAPTSSTQRVLRFDSTPAPPAGDATASLASAIASPPLVSAGITPTVGLEIDADSDGGGSDEEHLLVARDPGTTGQNTVVQEFDIPGVPTDPITAGQLVDTHVFAPQSVNGLGVNSATGNIYLSFVSTNGFPACGCGSTASGLVVLNVPGAAPVPTALTPTDVTATEATLHGSLVPGSLAPVSFRYEYSANGLSFTTAATSGYASGVGAVTLPPAPIASLDPNTTYRVRVVATRLNSLTTPNTVTSPEAVFLTDSAPPEVVTLPVGPRTDTTAELRGTVDPNGTATNYWIEYGGTTSYGKNVPLNPASAGNGTDPLHVAEQVSGLVPETTYHYRIVADGFGPPVAGSDQTFTTLPTPTPSPPIGTRGFELVSPADKPGGAGVGEWYRGPASLSRSGVAAHTAERFLVEGHFGSVIANGAQGYGNDLAQAERASDQIGWVSRSPLTHPHLAGAYTAFISKEATSDDLSSVVYSSNNSLLLFPEVVDPSWDALNANLSMPYLADWGTVDVPTRWEIWGPSEPSLFSGTNVDWALRVAGDAPYVVGQTPLNTTGIAAIRGMAGPGDPTHGPNSPAQPGPDHPGFSDLLAGRSIYAADLSDGPADSFAGTGPRELVNVCTGALGVDRTTLPSVEGSGNLVAEECPAPGPDRESTLISGRGAALHGATNEGSPIPDDVISSDGRRVFFLSPDPLASGVPNGTSGFCSTSGQTCPPQLYVRQRDSDGSVTTRWISRPEDGLLGVQDATLTGTARFEGVTPDGDKVFFRTNSPLTVDDPNGTGGPVPGGVTTGTASNDSWDLYVYDFPDASNADIGDGELTRISAGPEGDGDCNSPFVGGAVEITAALRFASDDGSRVYFTCSAPLDGVPAPANGTVTSPSDGSSPATETSLYVYDSNRPQDQRWRFVARLPRGGVNSVDGCAANGYSRFSPISGESQRLALSFVGDDFANCVRGTRDGTFITFMTTGRLTADDPPSPSTADLYAYDATRDVLERMSSARDGAAGGTYACAPSPPASESTLCHGDTGLESHFGAANGLLGIATHPLVDGDHVAFFHSQSALTPDDTDAAYDVYQWRNGHLSLLTPATSDHAMFKGNDRSGRNVYFVTRDALTWQDFDAVADVYTVRVGGGIPEPTPPPVCSLVDDTCQDPSSAVPISSPVDTGGSGSGNADDRRAELSILTPSKRSRSRAASRGVLRLRVRVSSPTVVSASVTARIGRRKRLVGTATKRVGTASTIVLRLPLRRVATAKLASGGALRLRIAVRAGEGPAQAISVVLRRGGRR